MIRLSIMVDVILLMMAARAMMTTADPSLTLDPVQKCLPCEDLFTKLEAGPDGRLSQVIEIQQRGEPKSGTSMMAHWADAALEETCTFLGSMYGSETCTLTRIEYVTLLQFLPGLSPADSACPCDKIDR